MTESPADQADPMPPESTGSRRRWIKRAAALAFVLLVCCCGWLLIDRELTDKESERELARARAAADASDPDWTWERLNEARPRPPKGKNGAPLIPMIKQKMPATWGKELAKEEWNEELDVPPNVRYPPAVIEHVRGELAASTDALEIARKLQECPFGLRDLELTPNVIDIQHEETQTTRTIYDLLRWEAVIAIEDGDPRRAIEALRALLNAARSIGDEPVAISQLVRMAGRGITAAYVERVLAQTSDAPDLADLQAALAADAEDPLLLYCIRGERAMFDRLLENVQTHVITYENIYRPLRSAEGRSSRTYWQRLGLGRSRANLLAERAYALEWMSQHVEIARHPAHEQPALFAAVPEIPDQFEVAKLLLPAVQHLAHADWRSVALERCAVAGIACERYRQHHKRWPDTLVQLAPEFLPSVPLDPFDGLPLRYAKSKEGAAVYSVGKPAVSSSGFATDRPGLPAGVEYGFRLWNPNFRRLPPLLPRAPAPHEPENEPQP
jgi:hypothetical protein